MQKFTAVVVLSLTVISLFEVFMNSQEADAGHAEDSHDAFSEFDDPSDQYTASQKEHEEPLEIREQVSTEAGKSTFVPPIDMPPIRFAFW